MTDVRPVTWRAPAPRWRRNTPVGFLRPCELTLADRPPAGPGWLHEVKHDGFRILAWKQGEPVQIWSRRGADFANRFLSRIAEAARGRDARSQLWQAISRTSIRPPQWSACHSASILQPANRQ